MIFVHSSGPENPQDVDEDAEPDDCSAAFVVEINQS